MTIACSTVVVALCSDNLLNRSDAYQPRGPLSLYGDSHPIPSENEVSAEVTLIRRRLDVVAGLFEERS